MRLQDTSKALSFSKRTKVKFQAFCTLFMVFIIIIISPLIILLSMFLCLPLKAINKNLNGGLLACCYGKVDISFRIVCKAITEVGLCKTACLTLLSFLISPLTILIGSIFYLVFLVFWSVLVLISPFYLLFRIFTCSCEKDFKSES